MKNFLPHLVMEPPAKNHLTKFVNIAVQQEISISPIDRGALPSGNWKLTGYVGGSIASSGYSSMRVNFKLSSMLAWLSNDLK